MFAIEDNVEFEATWGIYQRMFADYSELDWAKGRDLMAKSIDSLTSEVPAALTRWSPLAAR